MIHTKDRESSIQELKEIRSEIIQLVQACTGFEALLTEFENCFLAYVLLPGFQLQQTIRKRIYLEREYNCCVAAVEKGLYKDSRELNENVRQILRHAEVDFLGQESEVYERLEGRTPLDPGSGQDSEFPVDGLKKNRIVKEFKRIVIPRVHADTSDTPYEIFRTVYESYKKKDYLMMAAFTIQYREEKDLIDNQPDAGELLEEYRLVHQGLEKRIQRLQSDFSRENLGSNEELVRQMKKQNSEIRKAMIEEAEKILFIRNCLDNLTVSKDSKRRDN